VDAVLPAWLTAADVGVAATAVLSVLALVGLLVRFVLMPYLREQLVEPIRETHRQVTQTHPVASDPTLVDRLEEFAATVDNVADMLTHTDEKVTAALRTFGRRTDATEGRVQALRQALDQHVSWAREEDSRLWNAVQLPPTPLPHPSPTERHDDDTHT
jgi:hypothetical protein